MNRLSDIPVTLGFLAACLAVSVPSALSPACFEVFSGELPHEYWWQNFTMAFQHGASGVPLAVLLHLGLNMAILLTCGAMTERLVGSAKFLALTLAAWCTFVAAQSVSGIWINGSSGIIWAYSPFLLVPILRSNRDKRYLADARRARGLLVVMWVIIPVLMGFIPLAFNRNHTLLHTFFYGNLFHFISGFTGAAALLRWRPSAS